MTLTPSEAAASLKAVEATTQRSAQALNYANSSPYFILWGAIWVIGYAGSDLIPRLTGSFQFASYLWLALTVTGLAGCFRIGRSQHRAQFPGRRAEGRRQGLRWFASMLVIWIFIAATFLVIGPRLPIVQGAFFPLLVAMFYGLLGVWKGLRYLYAGLAVTILTLGGFFYLREFFLLWMAIVGGGSLILVGLWLKRV